MSRDPVGSEGAARYGTNTEVDPLTFQLYGAARYGYHTEVLDLLKKGVDPNSDDFTRVCGGVTPLHRACKHNRPSSVLHLVLWGARLDATDKDNRTPLHYACLKYCFECAMVLLKHHCRTDIKSTRGDTALVVARRLGYGDLADFIDSYDTPPRAPLSSYPSIKQLSQLQVAEWRMLGCHLGLSEALLDRIKNDEQSTASTLLAAKIKNPDLLSWKSVVTSLLSIEEYKLAERILQGLEDGHSVLSTIAYYGWLDLLKFLVEHDGQLKPDGCLLCAAQNNHEPMVEFLLDECHCNPNITDEGGNTPLALTDNPAIIRHLLKNGAQAENVYKAHRKLIGKLSSERPPEIPLPVFITGDGGVGKSTLLKSMISSKGFRAKFTKARPVTGVDEKTVGIIPYDIVTKEFGRVICHDFAGQQEFYASHCAVLKNAVHTSSPIVIYCADLQESEKKMTDSTAWWMTLIQNQCTALKGKAHVIVVGSHADKLNERREITHKESIFAPIIKKFPTFEFVAFTAMDCRFPDSPEMKQVKKLIQNSSALLRSPEAVIFNAHAFNIYLLDSFKDVLAVSLKVVQSKIRDDLLDQGVSEEAKNIVSFIPTTLPRLVEICIQLSKKSLILFLHNEASPEDSFIVCDCDTLLSKVTGTVFAPEGFRQHCSLASSTGVVPLSKFSEAFPGYDIEMLIAFMSHLELCFEIKDEKVLGCIRNLESGSRPDSRYLFFSGLIRIPTPEQVWEQDPNLCYHFGWELQTSQDTEFFDPRCFQVLILRLVFIFRLAPATRIQHDVPSLQRFCSVWKSGICWCNDDGVTTHLELSDNGKSFALKMRSEALQPACLEHRSKIINIVREAVADFCPHVGTVESVIDPQQVVEHPLKDSSSLALFSVPDIAAAIASEKDVVKSSMHRALPIKRLIKFEPFAGLDHDTNQCIHSEKSIVKNETISNRFISHFADQVADPDQARMYRGIFNPQAPLSKSSQSGNSRLEVVHSLEKWRKETEGTYTCLRETLNKFSVFTGRNPLDLARVPHRVCSPLMLSDKHSEDVQGELSLDEHMVKVREATWGLRAKWQHLAIQLGIDQGTIEVIREDNRHATNFTDDCFTSLLKHWLSQSSPRATWAALIEAIRSPPVDHLDIANSIEAMATKEQPDSD